MPIKAESSPLLLVTFEDATQRLESLRTLQNNEERYRTLFNSMDQGYCVLEVIFNERQRPVDLEFLEVNRMFEAQSGLYHAVGQRMSKLLPDLEAYWYELYGRIALTGQPEHFVNQSKPLEERWFDVYAFRLGGAESRIVAALFKNITQQRLAEQNLLMSESRYRRLFESAGDGILILDASTMRVVDSNLSLHKMLGSPDYQLEGKQLKDIGLFAEESQNKKAQEELLRNGHIRFDDVRLKISGGTVTDVEFTGNVYREDDHLVAQCHVRDISARKELERKTAEQARYVAESSKRKDEFLAMLSHELRNPLAPIFNALQLLGEETRENKSGRELCGIIERQVQHLVRLVDDLLEISRISTGKISLHFERVEIKGIIDRAVERVEPRILSRQQNLVVSRPEHSLWLQADPVRLEQVVGNLLHNASKFTDRRGTIWLTVETEEDNCVIRVRDNGMGIAPELLPVVFNLFTQADKSLDRARGGLGIGLALVRRIIELHSGTVTASSEGSGHGSEFVIRLPLCLTTLPLLVHEQAPPAESPATPRTLRVLIVDDNVDSADSCGLLLSSWGHEVLISHDGPDALLQARDFLPHVILCDIGLPKMNGYEVARRVRSDPHLQGVLLIALTGYGTQTDQALALKAGFDHHLTKPYRAKLLKSLLTLAPPVR